MKPGIRMSAWSKIPEVGLPVKETMLLLDRLVSDHSLVANHLFSLCESDLRPIDSLFHLVFIASAPFD
jgi:hypothetical protein